MATVVAKEDLWNGSAAGTEIFTVQDFCLKSNYQMKAVSQTIHIHIHIHIHKSSLRTTVAVGRLSVRARDVHAAHGPPAC